MRNDRPHHDFRITVVDVAASSADVSFHGVAFGNAAFEVRSGRRNRAS